MLSRLLACLTLVAALSAARADTFDIEFDVTSWIGMKIMENDRRDRNLFDNVFYFCGSHSVGRTAIAHELIDA
jgi:hypothetical protein